MTEEQRYTLIIRLKCCIASAGDCNSTSLQNGGADITTQLTLLNGYIDILTVYNTETDTNCVTEDEFESVVNKAKKLCKLCDCQE
jgi:hypothetical protein